MKKILFSLVAAAAFVGCINTVKHVPLGQTVDVYRPTRFVACDAVGVWWNDDYCRRYPIEASWMKLTWLVWVVDLPCEAVMDTVWLPYDYCCMKRYDRKRLEQKPTRFGAGKPAYVLDAPYTIDIGD